MSWNAGHLGQQQWSEINTWLQLEAEKMRDVLVLQETHWQESAEFTVSSIASCRPVNELTASVSLEPLARSQQAPQSRARLLR